MDDQLRISLIQADLAWEDKSSNLAMFEEKISRLKGLTEVVVLPEMFSTGFSMNAKELAEPMSGATIAWMKKLAVENRVIITGSVIIEDEGKYFNRLVWMLPNAQYGCYDKRHLFAFAGEHNYYSGGNKKLIASVKGWKVNLMVCYDLRFPAWSRQQPVEGEAAYDVLIYVANWPEKRNHAWKTLLQARAIENQCYVVGVNRVGDDGKGIHYSGDSMVVDPLGEILYTKTGSEDIYTVSLSRTHLSDVRQRLPFLKDADRFDIHPE
jgi:predicted amidohydrolase